VGKKISFVDYMMYDLLVNNLVLAPGCLDGTPLLKAFHDRIAERKGIHEYRQSEGFLKRPVNGNGKQ